MTDRPPLRKAAAGAIIAVFAVLVLAADQFTKYLALQNLPFETPVPVLGDFLIFYLVRNPGAAFSLGEGVTWIFTIALAAVSVLIVWLAATRIRSRLWAVALGLHFDGTRDRKAQDDSDLGPQGEQAAAADDAPGAAAKD